MADSERATVRRLPELASYDRTIIESVIDQSVVCHIAFVHDGGPVVIPTLHGREGDVLYIHGSPASRMIRSLGKGTPVSAAFTILDGFVLARSLFHSSMNYRSVVLFGSARRVNGVEKLHGLRVITDRVLPGRWDHARLPTEQELTATGVVAIHIDEASAKVRRGPPEDDPEDYSLPLWAGVVPLELRAGRPVPDPEIPPGVETPVHVTDLVTRRGGRFPVE